MGFRRWLRGTNQKQNSHHPSAEQTVQPPAITENKKDKKEIKIKGTSLLTNKGCYRASIPLEESTLLLILQDHTHHQISLAIPIGGKSHELGLTYVWSR